MGFNRTPHYTRNLLLVGDAGGVVNPFNGEGIAYAMETGRLAAEMAKKQHHADLRAAQLVRSVQHPDHAISDEAPLMTVEREA